MDKDFYVNGADAQRSAYTTYLTSLLTLSGLGADEAAQRVAAFYDAEAAISAASLDPQDYSNVDKTYNLFTLGELKTLLPNVDLNAVLAASGIENAERIMVSDVGALKAPRRSTTTPTLPCSRPRRVWRCCKAWPHRSTGIYGRVLRLRAGLLRRRCPPEQ